MSVEDYEELEEGEDDGKNHSRLIKAINQLDKTQHINKPSRTGYSEVKSEFHVARSGSSKVAINDIIKILQSSTEHVETGKKLKVAQSINKTLNKPAEKHVIEKIKRSTGFESVKVKLSRWDAVVTRNRALEHQRFPLEKKEKPEKTSKTLLEKFTFKSELEQKLDEVAPAKDEIIEDMFPLTMHEMLEHRREAAKLRARQSYKEAKARRQSRIKSKKFHRVLRKDKIKKQLKEFETLQKTDPEEALRRLEQLEKTRAQERVTLRHKSTGQWAKNKLVRAKYDKETRQELAQQLSLSRELTKKITPKDNETDSEDDSDNPLPNNGNLDPFNPWLPTTQPANEVTGYVSSYKKYWDDINKANNNQKETDDISDDDDNDDKSLEITEVQKSPSSPAIQLPVPGEVTSRMKERTKTRKSVSVKSTSEWLVESNSSIDNHGSNKISINHMFNEMESKLHNKITDKLKAVTPEFHNEKKKKGEKRKKSDLSHLDLSFKNIKKRPQIDEELIESTNNKESSTMQNNNIKNLLTGPNLEMIKNDELQTKVIDKIDPNIFVAPKPKHLLTALPDMETEGDYFDDDERDSNKMTIAEAFEDDDIVAEFQRDKETEINKDKPQIEDESTLPGWGSWAGKNLSNIKQRRRRMIFKTPEVRLPRKDDKKDNVIINQSRDVQLKPHQVSELPFPFTSVRDFECTIRAPLGNTFIPETAHRKLTRPAVIVKTGIVIEPMDDNQLINSKSNESSVKFPK